MTIAVRDAPTFSYPKIKYTTAAGVTITREFVEPAIQFGPQAIGMRGQNFTSSRKAEYLSVTEEETLRVDMRCESEELQQLRWFLADHGNGGSQFEAWIDRHTGSHWLFEDTLRDQNGLAWTHFGGAEAYAAATRGRGVVLGSPKYLSVALAQASAATKTGYDDPLAIAEGVVIVDFKPTWAHNDGVLHVLLDTSGPNNRLQVRKTAANTLVLEITDSGGGVKSMSGTPSWAANDRVQIMAGWASGTLRLWYQTNSGVFTSLTTGAGAGTGILSALPTTLFLGVDNTGAASHAAGTYDSVCLYKKAYPLTSSQQCVVLADYHLPWRNYFPYAEVTPVWEPQRYASMQRMMFRWPLAIRNGRP